MELGIHLSQPIILPMVQVSIQKPCDQPTGTKRLLNELRNALRNRDFNDFRMIVAFAKVGPLLRLNDELRAWSAAGRSVRAIFGFDQQGTSKQALEYAIAHFSEVHVAHCPSGAFNPTFHPKIYLFTGPTRALAFVGSSNLTVGGTESNFETSVTLDLSLPGDDDLYANLSACWTDALASAIALTPAILLQLVSSGVVLDEMQMRRSRATATSARSPSPGQLQLPFPNLPLAPPSPIPRSSLLAGLVASQATPAAAGVAAAMQVPLPSGAQALVMQISPHHNGEVFLSKNAVNQDPAFFGWPFTGRTTPKRPSNPAYPQRVPDPVVDLQVFDATGARIIRHNPFSLNTVYYEPKAEIRVTVPKDVVQAVPDYSILLMRHSSLPTHDYEMTIYLDGSSQYAALLQVCNQTMPSGGKPVARRFGWI